MPDQRIAYCPGSGTEGADFEAKWCQRCKRDADCESGDGCVMLANAYAGKPPQEWRLWRGEAVCDAFDPIEPGHYPHLNGCAVRDLFPGSSRRPSVGEQIRMLVTPRSLQ